MYLSFIDSPSPLESPGSFPFISMAGASRLVNNRHSPPPLVVSTLELPHRMGAGKARTISCSLLHPCAPPWTGLGVPSAIMNPGGNSNLSSQLPSEGSASLAESHLPHTPCPLPSEAAHPCHQEGLCSLSGLGSRLGRGDQHPGNTSMLAPALQPLQECCIANNPHFIVNDSS